MVRISVHSVLLVASLGMVAASCGTPVPPGEGEVRSSPVASAGPTSPAGAQTPELGAACGPVPFEWPVGDPGTAFEPFEGDIEALVHDAARVEFDLWSPARWSVVEETPTGVLLFGEEVSATTDGPRYRFARFEFVDGEWRAAGWGGCRIQVTADGFGVATFELDPANPPDAAATTLHLLATERACASGKAPGGREVVPVVVADSEGVEIIVLVESPARYQPATSPRRGARCAVGRPDDHRRGPVPSSGEAVAASTGTPGSFAPHRRRSPGIWDRQRRGLGRRVCRRPPLHSRRVGDSGEVVPELRGQLPDDGHRLRHRM